MKRLSIAACAAAVSLAGAGAFAADPTVLSDSELDTVVAGSTSTPNGDYNKRGKYGGSIKYCGKVCTYGNDGILNGNNILSGNDVNILNGNNTAVGVGILGTGALQSLGL